MLATGGSDQDVHLWTPAGRSIAVLRGHSLPILALAFSADGRILASGASDSSARIWDVPRRRLVVELRHPAEVSAVDVSADGRFVVTGSWDRGVRVWETATGLLVTRFRDNPAQISSVDLSSDGRTIVAVGILATAARLYQCDLCGSVDDLLRDADQQVHRTLTPEERVTYLHEKGDAP